MMSKFFYSLTAFSLGLVSFVSAEEMQPDEEFEELVFESDEEKMSEQTEEASAQKHHRIAFPRKIGAQPVNEESKNAEEQVQKRQKPHFAGVRRPEIVKESIADAEKKSAKKAKSKWFSSKTHPKVEKKEVIVSEPVELPSDRPYFQKTNYIPVTPRVAAAVLSENKKEPLQSQERSVQDAYPRTGFEAPRGHIFVTGEWLYWRTRQEGMEFATSKQMEFEFQSGFRAGIGAHLPSFDGWEIYVNYTYFNPEHSHSSTGSFYPLFLFQGAGTSGAFVTEASGHWNIRFQSADVEFGKSYYLTPTLIFHPFFGLKGVWIDQQAHFHYEGGYIPVGQVFSTHFENDFKGAGPLFGTQINWELGRGVSLFGDVATALIAGQFYIKQRQNQLSDMEVVHYSTDFNLVSPILQLVAGVRWDRNFNKDQCHVGLSAGFETQYLWNQNQTEQFTDDELPIYVRQRGDLAFYGLTLRGRLDF